jgi:hypothetical protein
MHLMFFFILHVKILLPWGTLILDVNCAIVMQGLTAIDAEKLKIALQTLKCP